LDISRGNLRFIIKNLRSLEDKFLFVIQKGNPKNPANYPYKHNIHKKLANQFKFLGYIPLKEYKLRHGYAYITSNISIEGIIYIYPMRLVDDYRKMRPGYYQWQRIFEHHSIAGFTRINYSFSYNKLKMLSI
jgi:hypothetical protein